MIGIRRPLPIDLELIRTFRSVVHLGGMRRASQTLHVTQPAVSARIRELERRLDAQLFERVGRSLHLTEAGRLLLDESATLLDAADALQQHLAQLRGLERGTLRLATIDAVSIYLLPNVYLEFMRTYPQIDFRVQVVDSQHVARAVRDLDADLGFLALPGPRSSAVGTELEVEPLYSERLIAVARPGHALTRARRVDLATLAAEPLVLYARGSNTRAALDAVFGAYGITPNVVMETGSPEAMKRLAEVGMGIAILPEELLRTEVRSGRLGRVRLAGAQFERTLALVRRRGRLLGPAVLRFQDLLHRRWGRRRQTKKNRDPSTTDPGAESSPGEKT
ncbi:MAG: LysR family transcriptional regulator [Candidatus Latescibacterota bacterium]|nr:MAG: LysR family transcriptional regulator [Candidatus Latescibacterota bacterium]